MGLMQFIAMAPPRGSFRETARAKPCHSAQEADLTSSPPLAFGHRLRGKDGDSYGAQAWHEVTPESLRRVPAAGGIAAPLT